MMTQCPNCKKGIDYDGFFEHGLPTLFYCECGKLYDKNMKEVPKEEVDLVGIDGYPIEENFYNTSGMSRGIFININRWRVPK